MDAMKTQTMRVGEHFAETGQIQFYQLGLKHHGKTDIVFSGREYRYYDNTVLYLPMKSKDMIYKRTIRECGDGACLFFYSMKPLYPEAVCMDISAGAHIAGDFFRLVKVFARDRENGSFSYMSVFYDLLSALRALCLEQTGYISTYGRLASAKEYMDLHYTEPYLDLCKIASLVGLSQDHFRHRFREVFGVSPLQYINRRKLEQAKLLLSAGHSVGEVATSVGYADTNYFARVFRTHTGITPREYRNLIE